MAVLTIDEALTVTPKEEAPTMIALKGIEKVYRTDRIETVALSGINLDGAKASSSRSWGPRAAARARCST